MRRFIDWLFRDRATGAIVIGQWPNLPLWLFGASAGTAWLIEAGGLAVPGWLPPALQILSIAALTWWAADEVIRGVNPWRRFLGAGVLLFEAWRVLGSL